MRARAFLIAAVVLGLLAVSFHGSVASAATPSASVGIGVARPSPQAAVTPAAADASWTLLGTQSPPRDGHGFVYDSKADRYILFGGAISGTVFTNSTWSYDYANNTWTNITPVVSPSPRVGAGMVYDSRADRVILFGGTTAPAVDSNETWTFDYANDTWTRQTPGPAPPARIVPAIAYDAGADRTILFGGANETGPLSDTWAYDAGTDRWTVLSVTSPGSIYAASMAYAPSAGRDILFGGLGLSGSTPVFEFKTRAFDYTNVTWTDLNPPSHPTARAASAFSFDSAADRAILFGGTASFTPGATFNDTWVYSYSLNAWTNVTPASSPSPRLFSVMDYDVAANRTVLFGGATANGIPYNDAWSFRYAAGLPDAPRNLVAPPGAGRVTLAWRAPLTDGGSPITNYTIYRGTASGGESLLVEVANVLTFDDTAVTAGTTYFYEVAAVTAIGEGPRSNEVSATPPTSASAPQNLAAVAGNAQVVLTWDAPASDGGSAITGYDVYRGTTSGGETLLAGLGVVLTYTDTAVTNGVTYYYEVSAVNGVGAGPKSNEVSATPATVPSAPQNLAAAAGDGQVALTWQAPSSDGGTAVTGYRLYRGSFAGTETLLATLGVALSYTDMGLTNGHAYYYQVSATNAVGEGSRSNEVSATPVSSATVPSAPQSLVATAGNAQVVLTWQAPVSDGGAAITGFKIYRGTSSGSEAVLTTVGSVLTYTDSTVTNGVTYYYQVSAVNREGEGSKSYEAHATPAAPVVDTTPPSVTITSPANNSVLTATTVTVLGSASDNAAVAKIELSTDGTHWSQASGTTSWSGSLTLVEGANTIYARATDTSNNVRVVTVTVTVQTAGPTPQAMDPLLLAGIGAVIVIAALAAAFVVWRRRKKALPPPPPPPPPPEP